MSIKAGHRLSYTIEKMARNEGLSVDGYMAQRLKKDALIKKIYSTVLPYVDAMPMN